MMNPPVGLPGLEHLIAVCRGHGLLIEQRPSVPGPHLKETLFGQAVDPVLREAISRFNMKWLEELHLLPLETTEGIEPRNQRLRENAQRRAEVDDELWQRVLLYADFQGLPYCLATVPSLADGNGIQPVVFIVRDTEKEVIPIASSVDVAFDLYARYLEARIERDAVLIAQRGPADEWYRRMRQLQFPYEIPELVAGDRRLVEMLEAHRFDFFAQIDSNLPTWSASVQRAAHERS